MTLPVQAYCFGNSDEMRVGTHFLLDFIYTIGPYL